MRFVVDVNVLFSFFWKDSFTRRLLIGKYFELCAPEFALEEIDRYKDEIMREAKIGLEEFVEMRRELVLYVEFFSLGSYGKFLSKATKVSEVGSRKSEVGAVGCRGARREVGDDVDYFGLALKLGVGVWSNDKVLKSQEVVGVLNTMEVLELVGNEKI